MKAKKLLSLLLVLCMIIGMVPGVAMAADEGYDYEVGAIVTQNGDDSIPSGSIPEGATWSGPVQLPDMSCGYLFSHSHSESCYTKICDHKDGHMNTCYSSSTSYSVCNHSSDTEHTGSVTITDVVSRSGLSLSWNTEHPAYPAVKTYYDGLSGISKITALFSAKFCYTTTAGEEPTCGHACSELSGRSV